LEGKEKSRSVYLPEGCDWYDFWIGRRYAGGQTVLADAALDTMPLFVRAGAFVPMGPEVQSTEDKVDSPIELRIYPGQDGSFIYYEDAGDGYEYEKGELFRSNGRNSPGNSYSASVQALVRGCSNVSSSPSSWWVKGWVAGCKQPGSPRSSSNTTEMNKKSLS
jgi:alpha-glucosidase (family GH31 glycosyl hydrolase)